MKTIRLIILFAIVIFTSLVNAQTVNMPDTIALKSKLKTDLKELFKTPTSVYKFEGSQPNHGKYYCSENSILVFDNRLELKRDDENMIIYFLDMLDYNVTTSLYVSENVWIRYGDFLINFNPEGKEKLKKMKDEKNRELISDILLVLNTFNKERYKDTDSFKPIAEKYRSLTEKPPVSEDQRRYIVQANGFNEQKNYGKAIELYIKAIKLDQSAYPAAYSNLAMLSAQIDKFDAAIYYMKKYLMLEPESPDARGAQDKIYLWEAKIVN